MARARACARTYTQKKDNHKGYKGGERCKLTGTKRVCESLIETLRAKWINKRKQEDCDEEQGGKSEQEWQMEA